MGRPRKTESLELKVMTLQELEKLWADYIGRLPETPIEYTPSYATFCARNPSFWHSIKDRRMAQMQKLHLIETNVIDYYENTNEPMLS
jgi:hypothetical protein